MLDNPSYNKMKLLYKLSCITWFIEKHALDDAQNAGDKDFYDELKVLQHEIEKHIEVLQKSMCRVTH